MRLSKTLTSSLLLIASLLGGCAGLPLTGDRAEPVNADRRAQQYAQAIEAFNLGDSEAAERSLTAFIEQFPDVAAAHASLGMLYARNGRDELAAASLQIALELDPGLAAAHNELGMVHRRAGRFEQARDAYLAALALDASHMNAHRNLGVLYDLYLGQPELALPHYEQYRSLPGADDPLVAKWVTDLKRRIDQDTKTARLNH